MILGIGTDIVSVSRVQEALEKYGDRFKKRVFTDKEIAYCESQKNKYQHFAARFAAKEAGSKAMGTGISGGTTWTSIEVVKIAGGQPLLEFHGVPAEKYAGCKLHVSLSHTAEYATAIAIIESTEVAESDIIINASFGKNPLDFEEK